MESSKYEIKEVPINDYSLHMNLKILNVQKHDFGTYVCASVNALGKVEGSVRLQGKWNYCTDQSSITFATLTVFWQLWDIVEFEVSTALLLGYNAVNSAVNQPTFRRNMFQTVTRFMFVLPLAYFSALNMKFECSSETSVDFHRATRRYIPMGPISFRKTLILHRM
jgi:hypothetical protein